MLCLLLFNFYIRLESHDFTVCIATLVDPQTGAAVNINTQLIEPFEAKIGSLFQVLGDCSFDGTTCTLKARVIRCVDGMDIVLYKKTLQAQREYFKTRTSTNSS